MPGGLGVYVHVPFCATRCDYCAFATWTDREHLIDAYVDACIVDVERHVATGELTDAHTVYFGGGTPSLIQARDLVRILDAIPRVSGAEVTVECNPDSVDSEKLRVYAGAGVSRVSLGVQSTQPNVLTALGRTHDRANVARAVDAIRAVGVASFNLDLIAGAAGETDADFDATLDDVLAFDPPHVSVYGLMVEPGTPLERRIAAGEVEPPDPDAQADRYLRADARLTGAGLEWYEVSNWARSGHECGHNLGYWTGADCVAIGAAAHGHTRGRRWANVPKPERYIERISAGESPEAGGEVADAPARARERFGLALRTRAGVAVPARVHPAALAEVVDAGLATVEHDRLVLTPPGRLLATEVTLRLMPDAGPAAAAGAEVGTRYDGVPARASQRPSSDSR
ncbi:MAG: radical SAM family heme chaperone HemW [Acidimicrobiia bacterium]